MRFPEIEKIVMDAVDAMIAAGVSREAAESAMRDAEFVAMKDLIETQSDRRLLDLFDQYGSAALAERKAVTPRTICNRRKEAAERLYRKQIGSFVTPPVSSEAA